MKAKVTPMLATADVAVPAGIIQVLATACGLIVANIYYAQPLVGPISTALGLAPGASDIEAFAAVRAAKDRFTS